MIKLSNEKFIEKSKIIHGNKYDYSLVSYTGARNKIDIICPIHGIFQQTPTGHLSGRGCYKCSGKTRNTTDDFIEKSRIIHGNKYDYSSSFYINKESKIKIICPVHGIFDQIAKNHIKGHGCPFCAGNNKKTTDIFIKESMKIHGGKFDYSLTNYNGAFEKVKIICKEHNSIFEVIPHNHLYHKDSCPLCNYRNIRKRKLNIIETNKIKGAQIVPFFNDKACLLFDKMSDEKGIFIQHALNGGEYYIKELGYFLDGYDKENNVAYEYNEKHHYSRGNLREKDLKREKEIRDFLKCDFIVIKD